MNKRHSINTISVLITKAMTYENHGALGFIFLSRTAMKIKDPSYIVLKIHDKGIFTD
jgi:hypothetical protein